MTIDERAQQIIDEETEKYKERVDAEALAWIVAKAIAKRLAIEEDVAV